MAEDSGFVDKVLMLFVAVLGGAVVFLVDRLLPSQLNLVVYGALAVVVATTLLVRKWSKPAVAVGLGILVAFGLGIHSHDAKRIAALSADSTALVADTSTLRQEIRRRDDLANAVDARRKAVRAHFHRLLVNGDSLIAICKRRDPGPNVGSWPGDSLANAVFDWYSEDTQLVSDEFGDLGLKQFKEKAGTADGFNVELSAIRSAPLWSLRSTLADIQKALRATSTWPLRK